MGLLSKYLINPRIEIDIKGDIPFTINSALNLGEPLQASFSIRKDLTEDENELELTIYNLNKSTRARMANSTIQSTPIEVFLTPAGKAEKVATPLRSDMVSAFVGEIDLVNSERTQPGYATTITAYSQRENHRAFHIEPTTFAKGTPKAAIISFLATAVGLPLKVVGTLPTDAILISESFSGPAFPMLQNYCRERGLYAYINDGVLLITSVYMPPNPAPKLIFSANMLSTPALTTRIDAMDVEMRTVIESTSINPFASINSKKTKLSKTVGANDYVIYQAVDKEITGIDYELLLQPDIQPDDLVTSADHLDYIGKITRVQEVHHYGNSVTFDDWTTELKTDDIDASIL